MTILVCARKMPDASLIYCTEPKTKTRKMKKKLKNKNAYAQKKQCRARNHGVSPEGGGARKSRVERICETGRFWALSEKAKEWWMVTMVSRQWKMRWQVRYRKRWVIVRVVDAKLSESIQKLIPEVRWSILKGMVCDLQGDDVAGWVTVTSADERVLWVG